MVMLPSWVYILADGGATTHVMAKCHPFHKETKRRDIHGEGEQNTPPTQGTLALGLF